MVTKWLKIVSLKLTIKPQYTAYRISWKGDPDA